jgi:hypothetical protein
MALLVVLDVFSFVISPCDDSLSLHLISVDNIKVEGRLV